MLSASIESSIPPNVAWGGAIGCKRLCIVALCVVLAGLAHGAPLPLSNTGNNGGLLPDGAVDPNYRLLVSPDLAFPGPNTFVTNDGFPIPPWVANGPNSKWISPRADAGNNNTAGNYTYRYTFDLSRFDPATAQITGTWATDNGGVDILLNGVSISPAPTADTAFTQPLGTYTFSAPVSSNFVACANVLDFVINNASTSANPTGVRVELSGTAAANTPVTIAASFAPNPVPVGTVSTLSFTLNNAGGNSAQSCLGFANALPAGVSISGSVNAAQCGGTVSFSGGVVALADGALAAGPSSCTVSINVTSSIPGSYPDTDAANVSGRSGNIDTTGVNATLVVLASADLATTAAIPPAATAGSTVNIPVTFSNGGPSTAANVVASANLPPGLSGVVVSNGGTYNNGTGAIAWPPVATLASAASLNYSVSYIAPPAGSVVFSATVASDAGDPNPGNNTASGTTAITASADLAVAASVPATATAGSTVNIPLSFANNGPSTAGNVTASASLPPGLSGVTVSDGGSYNSATGAITWPPVATLAAGASLSYSVSYLAPASGSVGFSAAVSSSTADPNPGNNSASGSTSITASADLAVTASVPPTAVGGNTVTIPLTFSNNGPSTANNVTVLAHLPAGLSGVIVSNGGSYNAATGAITWPVVPTLAGNVSLSYEVSYQAPRSGGVVFSLTVSSNTFDPTPGNNTFRAATAIAHAVVTIPTLTPMALMLLSCLVLVGGIAWRRRA